jgi:hypothetical protein
MCTTIALRLPTRWKTKLSVSARRLAYVLVLACPWWWLDAFVVQVQSVTDPLGPMDTFTSEYSPEAFQTAIREETASSVHP